jgi:hypothetical protein
MSSFKQKETGRLRFWLPRDCSGSQFSVESIALDYLAQGFSIVPQLPGGKHPCSRWKPYQTRQPTPQGMHT